MNLIRALLSYTAFVAVSAVLVAVGTRPLISWLKYRQLGKVIREDVPMHAGKAGTPTMGGLVLVAVMLAMIVVPSVFSWWLAQARLMGAFNSVEGVDYLGIDVRAALAIGLAVSWFGALGLVDDWQGLARKGRARQLGVGLTARRMFALQVVGALAVAWLIVHPLDCARCAQSVDRWELLPRVSFMPGDIVASAGVAAWLALAVLVIVAVVNGVNLSDGLDGLAAGLATAAFAGLAAVLALSHYAPVDTVVSRLDPLVLSLFIAGACLGFLVHNRYPARVFMGNVTSMALGAALATIALATGTWPLLPVIGIVYVAEVLSDIIQVGYFKWSGGKRVFRMAPLHHHFELGGMHETAVTRRFWLAGAIGAAVAVGFVYYATWGV